MTARTGFDGGIPAEQLTPEVREALARMAEENALLRAALADTRSRLGEVEQATDVDPLTGLANARELRRQVERAASQAGRHGTPAALLTIDLKGLDDINARHGRVAGDAALVHVGRLLKGLIRASDVAARHDGGFALLLDHLDPDSAVDTGERIAGFIAAVSSLTHAMLSAHGRP